MRNVYLSAALALLAGCGDPLLFAEVQAQRVCVKFPQIAVPDGSAIRLVSQIPQLPALPPGVTIPATGYTIPGSGGVVVYPDGHALFPDGIEVYPDGYVKVPGGVAVLPPVNGSVDRTIVVTPDPVSLKDVVPLLTKEGVTAKLVVLDGTLRDANGAADLSSIKSVDIQVSGATALDASAPPAPGEHALTMAGAGYDIAAHLNDGQLAVKVTMTGLPPTRTWAAELESCMSAQVKVDGLKAMQAK